MSDEPASGSDAADPAGVAAEQRKRIFDAAVDILLHWFANEPRLRMSQPVIYGIAARQAADGQIQLEPRQSSAETRDEQEAEVGDWLREQATADRTLMIGLASTVILKVSALEEMPGVSWTFEDAGGTFFIGATGYQIDDQAQLRVTDLMASEGFDAAHRLWPAPAARPPGRASAESTAGAVAAGQTAITQLDSYEAGGSLRDLDAGILGMEQLLAANSHDRSSEAFAVVTLSLCDGLVQRYQRLGDPGDLRRAITGLRDIAALDHLGVAHTAGARVNLVRALTLDYHRAGAPGSLDEAIATGEDLLDIARRDPAAGPVLIVYLTQAYLDRHRGYRFPTDLARASALIAPLTAAAPPSADWLPGALDEMRVVLARSPDAPADAALNTARRAAEMVAGRTLRDSDYRVITGYFEEQLRAYDRTGELIQLQNAITGLEQVLDGRLPWGSPYRVPLLELAVSAAQRAARRPGPGVPSDIAERVRTGMEELVALAPEKSPAKALACLRLADFLATDPTATDPTASDRALRALRDGLEAWEQSFATSATAYRLGVGDLGAALCGHLVARLVADSQGAPGDDGLRWEAFAAGERAKSRLLTEALGRGDLPVPADVPPDLADLERRLVARISAIDAHDLAAEGGPDRAPERASAAERQGLLTELAGVWERMASLSPGAAEYVELRAGRPASADHLRAVVAELGAVSAVLSLFIGPEQTYALLCGAGRTGPEIFSFGLGSAGWTGLTRRMWREVAMARGADRGTTWTGALEPLLAWLTGRLGGVERLVVVPHGAGHAIPWTVVAADLAERRGAPLALVVEPALAALGILRRRDRRSPRSLAVVVGDPRQDLPFASQEAVAVAGRLNVAPLLGADATHAAVLASARSAGVLHLAAHATFEPGDPLRSAVMLADGTMTARDLIGSRMSSNLVVLSACETGRAEPLAGDELAGLGSAIMHAGGRGLVVTLWPVEDAASGTLMAAFYSHCLAGLDTAAALARAAGELRRDERTAHPYYWAGFVLQGDWANLAGTELAGAGPAGAEG